MRAYWQIAGLALVVTGLAGCRKHSWEQNRDPVPKELAALGVEMDASGVKASSTTVADERVLLFFRRNYNRVALDYASHFEGKGYKKLDCKGRAATVGHADECFGDGSRVVHVKIDRREFPMLGTGKPMVDATEVEISLNPKHLRAR